MHVDANVNAGACAGADASGGMRNKVSDKTVHVVHRIVGTFRAPKEKGPCLVT